MAISRERAADILDKALGACSHWSRPVVLAENGLGRPTTVAFRDFEGVDRVVSASALVKAWDTWLGAESGAAAAPGSAAEADGVVQVAVYNEIRYPA